MLVGRGSGGGVRGMVQSQFEIQTLSNHLRAISTWLTLCCMGKADPGGTRGYRNYLSFSSLMSERMAHNTMRRLNRTAVLFGYPPCMFLYTCVISAASEETYLQWFYHLHFFFFLNVMTLSTVMCLNGHIQIRFKGRKSKNACIYTAIWLH